MQEGAKPISGPNEGEDYHLYQEFYKRKTKLAKDDFVRLKKIIDACNVEALENELDSNVTVQCSKFIFFSWATQANFNFQSVQMTRNV